MVTFADWANQRVGLLCRPLPRGTGTALFYRCSWCHRPRQYLYLLTWDPRAVFDPGRVEEEFGPQRTPTASGVEYEQGQAARETPAKTTRTVPLDFKDNATGEHFDVF